MTFVSTTKYSPDWRITKTFGCFCVWRFLRLGGRCAHHTISLPSMAIRRPSFKALSTQQTTSPRWPFVHPSETSVFLRWLIHVPVLLSSDPLWCLIPSWLCPPSVHGAARPVMNIQRSAYLTGLSLLSKPLGTILQPQKNTLNGSSSLPLCFSRFALLPRSLLPLSVWAFTKHIDPPDRGVHLPLITIVVEHWGKSWFIFKWCKVPAA